MQAGIALAFIGSTIIALATGGGGTGRQTLLGNGLALVGAITYAAYFLLGRRLRSSLSLVGYTTLVYGAAAVCLLTFALLSGQSFAGYSPQTYLLILLMALFPSSWATPPLTTPWATCRPPLSPWPPSANRWEPPFWPSSSCKRYPAPPPYSAACSSWPASGLAAASKRQNAPTTPAKKHPFTTSGLNSDTCHLTQRVMRSMISRSMLARRVQPAVFH